MSMFRIDGLASGMETYEMVQDLMKAHRKPVDKMLQQRQVLEWQREDYRALNTLLLNFRTNTVASLRLDAGFAAVSAGSSSPSVATAAAATGAANTSYNLNVTQLATNSYRTSTVVSSDPNAKIDADLAIWAQRDLFGSSFDIDEEAKTLNFTIITHDYDGTRIERDFVLDAEMSLNQVLAEISRDKELGVTAFYDAGADQVSFSTTRTGKNAGENVAEIQITGFLPLEDETSGQNARVTVNGMAIERPTNDFTLNGVNFSLKSEGSATITVDRDTDAIFQQVKNFISEYNGLLDILNGKLNEEHFRDYPPLLDDQDNKQQLTDRQIDQWQEKARSGLLRHDAMLSGIVTRLRTEVFSKVEGLGDDPSHLAQIGITIGTRADQGKLVIDEAKLRQAIQQDPEGVAKIFNQRGETTAEQGIAQRLYGSLDQAIKQVTARAGSLSSPITNDQSWIGRQITDLDKRVDRAEIRMEKLEDKYWRQFAAMERALNQMNAQSMWLTQQMGGGMM